MHAFRCSGQGRRRSCSGDYYGRRQRRRLCWATSHPPLQRDGFGPPVGPWQTGPWMLSLAPVPSASNTLLLLRPVPPVLPMMRRRRHLTPAKSMPWPSKTYVCFSNLFCVVFSRTYIHSIWMLILLCMDLTSWCINMHIHTCSASTSMGATSAGASSTSTFSMIAAAEAKSPP